MSHQNNASPKTPFETQLNAQERERLLEYAERKGMSPAAVLRQALRTYDLLEQTPGAYEAVNALTQAQLGSKVHTATAAAVPGAVDRDAQVKELIESYFWLNTLEPNTRYARLQDDHDGSFRGNLSIVIGEDGDAWIALDGGNARFRMPSYGGGASQYTRTALVILAEAIRRDNLERPLRIEPGAPGLEPIPDPCVCKGNWRALVRETEQLLDKRFRSHDGHEFVFFGLVHAESDYYFGMWNKEHGLRLLSCVGSIEGHGYTLVPERGHYIEEYRADAWQRCALSKTWEQKEDAEVHLQVLRERYPGRILRLAATDGAS